MASGIYKITSTCKPQFSYIGSSIDCDRRWREHRNQLLKGIHFNQKLQYHANKYGINDLTFKVIEYCPLEDLISRENYFLGRLMPQFNILPTAGSRLGSKHSFFTRVRMKRSAKKAYMGRQRNFRTNRFA